jgi:thioesterase domain-containing protein
MSAAVQSHPEMSMSSMADSSVQAEFMPSFSSQSPLLWIDNYIAQRISVLIGENPRFTGISVEPPESKVLPLQFSLEDLAACLVSSIRRIQASGPYCLGGWCNCGVLAYETAQQLRSQGRQVDLLVMMDAVNPIVLRRRSRWEISASKARFHLGRVKRLRIRELAEYTAERIAAIQKSYKRQTGTDSSRFDSRLESAVLRYEPRLYTGRVIALSPALLPSYRDPYLNWAGWVTGKFEASAINGNHKTMLEETGASDLAARIEDCIAGMHAAGDTGAVEELGSEATAQN